MTRKLLLFASIAVGLSISLLAGSSAVAAPVAQESTPLEPVRPDQYEYHGLEDMPYLSPPTLPEAGSIAPSSPVEQWSKMTFESYVDNNWEIYSASGSFTNLVRLTYNSSTDIHPRLNRGGTRIAFASHRDNNDYEIYTLNPDGTGLVQLTNNTTDDVKPVWSPDGTHIAFQSYRDGNAEVYIMHSDGTGQANLSNNADYDGEPSWSPDGAHIAFISRRTGSYRVYVMDANGANPTLLSGQRYGENPIWSPDGTTILYDADDDLDGWQEIWKMNSDGSNQRLVAEPYGDNTFWANTWSPDSRNWVYTAVHLINYNGQWYWDQASIYEVVPEGFTFTVNPGRLTDWNLDWSTTDTTPPTSSMSAPASPAIYQFTVSWSGQDNKAGILNYDVQYRDGPAGTWTSWQVQTTATSAVFTGLGGHTYYFRTRARDQAYNLQSWPAAQVSVSVESIAPLTHIDPVDPLIRGSQVSLTWAGADLGGSGLLAYDIQFSDASTGIWQDLLVGTQITTTLFTGETGHTYYFRSRGIDKAYNTEAWPYGNGDTFTTFFSWLTAGTARDNTGVPVEGMDVTVVPPAFMTQASDREGKYLAYLATNPAIKTIIWSKVDYGPLPPTEYGLLDANVDVYLPPSDNLVLDPGFESGVLPGAWQVGGDFMPVLTGTVHSGSYAASLGIPAGLVGTGFVGNFYVGGTDPIVTDRLGGVHVASSSFDFQCNISYAQRSPYGAWSTPEFVYDPIGAECKVDLVVDSGLNVHMLIQDYTGVLYTMRDTAGNWSAPVSVLPGADLVGMKIDGSGTIHALLMDDFYQYYARLTQGGAWEVEQIPGAVSTTEVAFTIAPTGEFYLAWGVEPFAINYLQRHVDDTWTEQVTFPRLGPFYSINLVVDSAGKPHLMWNEDAQSEFLMYTELHQDGSWDTPYPLSETPYNYPASLLIDSSDTEYALWRSLTDPPDMRFAMKTPQGIWSDSLNISPGCTYPYDLRAAISSSGDIYAAWEDYVSNQWTLYLAWRHNGVWSPPLSVSSASFHGYSPLIAVDSMEGAIIGWSVPNPGLGFHYISTQPNYLPGTSSISQSLNIPAGVTNPTLSFMADLYGVSGVSGNEFQVLVTDPISTTTLFTSTTPSGWDHYWFDLSPWSGEQITLTFKVSENAGFPPASALLDEVTIGAAHTDVWSTLSGGALFALPGDQFTFLLAYGNRSTINAVSSAITLTLPAGLNFIAATLPPTSIVGSQVTWQVGDLAGGSTYTPIMVIVQVDPVISLIQTITTVVEIATGTPEIELLNNTAHFDTLIGYVQWVPVLLK